MKYFLVALLSLACLTAHAGRKKVLFLGNSYTNVNNLPQIIEDIAASMGDTLIFDMEAPGSETLEGHFLNNLPSITQIKKGGWDYIVLQEQSQRPSYPISQVESEFFFYAHKLDSTIKVYNPCGKTMFYMTWGRKNGDSANCLSIPSLPLCTYEGMDSLLNLRYRMVADSNKAELSPVGAVWHYLRHHNAGIGLYQADESHPTAEGSYAAACSFYAAIFRRNPTLIPYNYTISATNAASIRAAAKTVVYDSLIKWHLGEFDLAHFNYSVVPTNKVVFTNTSASATTFSWDFGDGQHSAAKNPTHTYAAAGVYTVVLTASSAKCTSTWSSVVNLWPTGISEWNAKTDFIVSPNPTNGMLHISPASSGTGSYTVDVLNYMGQVVYQSKGNSAKEQVLDITHLANNVYLLRITNDEGVLFWNKVIKY